MDFSSIFADALEFDPQFAYGAHLRKQGFQAGSPASEAVWNQLTAVRQGFASELGSQILSGRAPTARFNEYVGDMDLQDLFKGLTPSQKGRRLSRYGMPARLITSYGR